MPESVTKAMKAPRRSNGRRCALLGLGMSAAGAAFLIAENIFYQTVDDNGVLQESLFLPLGAFALLGGGVLLAAALALYAAAYARRGG